VDDLQQEKGEIGERLGKLDSSDDAAQAITAIRRLRDHADDIRQIRGGGEPDDQRRIFTRTVRSVTWIRPEERLELRLVLPQPEPEESRVDYVRARGGSRTHMSRRTSALKADASSQIPPPGLDRIRLADQEERQLIRTAHCPYRARLRCLGVYPIS
jgi:hypothetical protein